MFRRLILKFFSKKVGPGIGRIGVCQHQDGIAIAHVVRPEGPDPELGFCDFLPLQGSGNPGSVLRKAVTAKNLENFRAVGIMPPGSYNLLQIEPPEVPENELRDAVRWQIKDLLEFPLEEAVVDVFPVPIPRRPGRARLAYAVATRTSRVKQTAEILKTGHLQIEAVDIPELALRNIAGLLPDNSQGVAVLHLDSHLGKLAIIQNSVLFLARNLSSGLGPLVTPSAGSEAGRNPAALSGLENLAETLGREVRRSLDFFESHFSLGPIESLVIFPLPRDIPELVSALQNHLAVKIRSLDMNALVKGPDISQELQWRCLLAMGGALRTDPAKP